MLWNSVYWRSTDAGSFALEPANAHSRIVSARSFTILSLLFRRLPCIKRFEDVCCNRAAELGLLWEIMLRMPGEILAYVQRGSL